MDHRSRRGYVGGDGRCALRRRVSPGFWCALPTPARSTPYFSPVVRVGAGVGGGWRELVLPTPAGSILRIPLVFFVPARGLVLIFRDPRAREWKGDLHRSPARARVLARGAGGNLYQPPRSETNHLLLRDLHRCGGWFCQPPQHPTESAFPTDGAGSSSASLLPLRLLHDRDRPRRRPHRLRGLWCAVPAPRPCKV